MPEYHYSGVTFAKHFPCYPRQNNFSVSKQSFLMKSVDVFAQYCSNLIISWHNQPWCKSSLSLKGELYWIKNYTDFGFLCSFQNNGKENYTELCHLGRLLMNSGDW